MRKYLLVVVVMVALMAAGCKDKSAPIQEPAGGQQGAPAGLLKADQDIDMLKTVIASDPSNVTALIKLGNIYFDTNRFKEAVEAYSKALVIDPKNVDVRVDLGTCYRYLGMSDLAEAAYRQAIKDNPNHPNAHMNLGVVLDYDMGRYAEALVMFERYLALAPAAPNAGVIKQEIERIKSMPKQ